ncbi:scavenger receptor cysteine-rich type 1 protein M160-like [Polymixia lowei]
MDQIVMLFILLWSPGLQTEPTHETESVRLVSGTSLCSGRVEVKTKQSWASVCEADFDQQDAEVVCREIGCGAPSVLQGALYGEVEAPFWTKEFQCEGSESLLLDCGTSGSRRNTCSPGKAVGLNCSESDDVRLVGVASRCAGRLEVKQGKWRTVDWNTDWNLKSAAVLCRQMDCGSAVSIELNNGSRGQPVWIIPSTCVESGSALRECVTERGVPSSEITDLFCSESVRLVSGTSLCSGRVEVKTKQSWASVCEDDFDQQDAEVVCREIGCGAPSVLQGALYGEAEAPFWTKEFQCEGSESLLLDCGTSGSTRNTCSPGKAVGLTCSESDHVRLVGGASRCAGTLEMKHHGEWRPVRYGLSVIKLKPAAVLCRQMDCGSAVSIELKYDSRAQRVWSITSSCVESGSSLRECVIDLLQSLSDTTELICSESVRLVSGTSLCSGRVEVKTKQSWASVCEADFDQQDAEVVCREIGCGAPSVLQGALYGEAEAPFWTKEFQCEESDDIRLVGGANRCAGRLEMKNHGEWRPVDYLYSDRNLKSAAVMCRQMDCGSVVSIELKDGSRDQPVWSIMSYCFESGSTLRECVIDSSVSSTKITELFCSESVRLVSGTSLCSGRVEVKTKQSWASVCEADFDQQDAEVVCREIGCGAPSVLQGALYGEAEAPFWTKEFQCEGDESLLLNCGTSGSTRNTCSPGKAVGLTCSESDVDVRLVGGASRCAGRLMLKHQGEWRPVDYWNSGWNLKSAAVMCRQMDCGSAVSIELKYGSKPQPVWWIMPACFESGSTLRECVIDSSRSSPLITELFCSGRVEVKTKQSWASVCEADFDQQDAEVVCREIDCGAPSVLQGALYGEVEDPFWTKEFQCEGNESLLLDCGTSGSTRNTCSPGKAVGLNCSESDHVRLVGGASRCAGRLEVKQGKWRTVDWNTDWNLKSAAVLCRQMDCGSAVSIEPNDGARGQRVWIIPSTCVESGSALRECLTDVGASSSRIVDLFCSGRVEVKTKQSWASVCEDDFDQQDAEVVCREIGCGAPSVLQGALYGEVEDPFWTKEFQCEGDESLLLDCGTSGSTRNTCSPGKAVGLNCSESDVDVKVVEGASRCAGILKLKHQGVWGLVVNLDSDMNLTLAAVLCRQMNCGSAVSIELNDDSRDEPIWRITSSCVESGSALRECVRIYGHSSTYTAKLTCSDLLFQPIISLSPSMHGVSENLSSVSQTLHLTVIASPVTAFIIRLVIMLLSITGLCVFCKATRRQTPRREENIELVYYNLGDSSAEGRLAEETETQDTVRSPRSSSNV